MYYLLNPPAPGHCEGFGERSEQSPWQSVCLWQRHCQRLVVLLSGCIWEIAASLGFISLHSALRAPRNDGGFYAVRDLFDLRMIDF
jgi:hypothetical protein